MKNVLVVLSAFVLTSAAHAADNTDFKWNAEIRARYVSDENPMMDVTNGSNNYQQSYWAQRDVLGLTMTKGEKLTAYFKLLHAAFWGADRLSAANDSDDNTARPNARNSENLMMLHEAWVWWKMNDNMSVKVGRGGVTIADGLVVGSNDWDNIPVMFEGVIAMYDTDFAKFAVFGVKGVDNGINGSRGGTQAGSTYVGTARDPQSNFYGLSVDGKNLPEFLKMANIHFMQINKDVTLTTNETANQEFTATNVGLQTASYGRNMYRYGITLGGDTAGIDYKATYAGHGGKYRGVLDDYDGNGNLLHVQAGYSLPEMMKFHVGAVYATASGDDNVNNGNSAKNSSYNGYDSFYYNMHNTAGMMDLFRLTNLTWYGLNAKIEPMETLEVGAQYLMFSRTKASATSEGVYRARNGGISGAATQVASSSNTNGGEVTGTASVGNDKSAIGTELDVWVTKGFENNISTTARYGLFTSGDYLKTTAAGASRDVPNASEFFLEAKMTF